MGSDYWDTVSLLRQHIEDTYMPPFRVAENLYFIGTKPASVHLIDTGDGLILLDSGYQEILYLVLNNIYQLGFSPYDIKLIVLTHGHIDHFGGARALRKLFGPKILIGKEDLDYVTGARDLSFAAELGMRHDEIAFFEPDRLLFDGDVIQLGNTTIQCVHTPGHTEGTYSFFFDIHTNNDSLPNTLHVGTHGGVGTNSMTKEFLDRYQLSYKLRDDFRQGLKKLRTKDIDIFIGNHQDQCNTIDKYNAIMAGNKHAFIDKTAWPSFLDSCEKRLDDMLLSESANC